jgi:nitroreductase
MFFNPDDFEINDSKMLPPVETWYDGITTRHSRRRYTGEKVPEEVLIKLEEISESFHEIPGVRSIVLRDSPNDLFTGIIGSYGAIKDAPHSIILIGDMSTSHVQEATGYHGEGLILEATANNVDSCWVGGMFKHDTVLDLINLEDTEEILAVIAVGYGIDDKSKVERMMSGLIGSHRRKAINDLLVMGSKEPKGWMLKALEAARLSPSAVNRQPWRFKIKGSSIEIHVKKGIYKNISPRLDCGIAMLHFELGTLKTGVQGTWELSIEEPYVKYVVS